MHPRSHYTFLASGLPGIRAAWKAGDRDDGGRAHFIRVKKKGTVQCLGGSRV